MISADFCWNPAENLLALIANDALRYYITCEGNSPFHSIFDTTNGLVSKLDTLITEIHNNPLFPQDFQCFNEILVLKSDMVKH